MAANINVTEDTNTIDIQDVSTFTIDINDLSSVGSISVLEDSSTITDDIIDTAIVIRTITLPIEELAIIEVTELDSNTLTIETIQTNVIEVTDNISIIQAAADAAAARTAGESAIWDQTGTNIHYTDGNVGIGLTDPNFSLKTSTDLFSPIISSSKIQIQGDGTDSLFIVKLNDDVNSKFVINLQGVTILGAFTDTPSPVAGGMFFSSSGEFYLGH
jgi:hypothetical protein